MVPVAAPVEQTVGGRDLVCPGTRRLLMPAGDGKETFSWADWETFYVEESEVKKGLNSARSGVW